MKNPLLTTDEFEFMLGESLKNIRLQKNLTRQSLCEKAGISVSALRHLENGEGATLKTFIRVMRALDKQDWLFGVEPKISINPLHMLKDNKKRQRASRTQKLQAEKA